MIWNNLDGDLVTILDTSDLAFALQSCRVLKLSILKQKEKGESLKDKKQVADVRVSLIREELKELRGKVDVILDYLDRAGDDKVLGAVDKSVSSSAQTVAFNGCAIEKKAPAPSPVPVKEFDPLTPPSLPQSKPTPPVVESGEALPKPTAPAPQPHQQQQPQVKPSIQSFTTQSQTYISPSKTTPSQMGQDQQQIGQARASSLFDTTSGVSKVVYSILIYKSLVLFPIPFLFFQFRVFFLF